jgi:hypothetical protein
MNNGEVEIGKQIRDFTDQPDDIQYPLFIGKKYDIVRVSADKVEDFTYTVNVVAFEKITTPAGDFDAYKLNIGGYWNHREPSKTYYGKLKQTIWVAPSAKRIVRSEYEDLRSNGMLFNSSVEELIKWEPKAKQN